VKKFLSVEETMKKVIMASTLTIALMGFNPGLLGNAKAAASSKFSDVEKTPIKDLPKEDRPSNNHKVQAQQFHVGEKPVKSFKDEKTGVVVDVYERKAPKASSDSLTQNTLTDIQATSGWDWLAGQRWYMNGDWNTEYTKSVFPSTGGDYLIRSPQHFVNTVNGNQAWLRIELWEEDVSYDDYITYWEFGAPINYWGYDYVVRDISNHTDGADGEAEFYAKYQSNYTLAEPLYMQYYD
jgi:hypothetical protein